MKLVKCPDCNFGFSQDVENCKNCGFPVSDFVLHEKDMPIATKQGILSKKGIIVFHSLFSLLLLIISVFIVWQSMVEDLEYGDVELTDVVSEMFKYAGVSIGGYWILIMFFTLTFLGLRKGYLHPGWTRLHVVFSLAIGPVLYFTNWLTDPYKIVDELFLSIIFYWIVVIAIVGIKYFNNTNHELNNRLKYYTIFNLLTSLIIVYLIKDFEIDLGDRFVGWGLMLIGEISFASLWLLLFIHEWIKSGFKRVG